MKKSREKTRYREMAETLLCLMGLLACGCIAGALLLWLAFLLPTTPMERNLQYSALAVEQEDGTSGEILFGDRSTFHGIFTDEIMLQNAIYRDEKSAWIAAAGIYRLDFEEENWHPADALLSYLAHDGRASVLLSYSRYWHGYLVVLKPLLLAMSAEEIKLLNLFLLTALFLAVLFRMERRGLSKLIPVFTSMCLLMSPVSVAFSLSLSVCSYFFLAASLFLLCHPKWADKRRDRLLFFAALGMGTSYFDFLTYPLVTLAVPLVFVLLLRKENAEHSTGLVIGAVLSWGFGYAGLWASKWLLGGLVLSRPVFADAWETLRKRTGADGGSRLSMYFVTIYRNLYAWKGLPYLLLCGGLLLFLIVRMIWLRKSKEKLNWKKLPAFLMVALLPLLWYAAALNHSYEHATFTFRNLAVIPFTAYAGFFTALSGTRSDSPSQLPPRMGTNPGSSSVK